MRERDRSINSTTDFLITPTMQAPLETSLVLRKGTGDPTWSRATKAWRFNELGYLEGLASGCASFGGVRLVRNICDTKSEDFTNAAWTKTALTAPSANLLVCANLTTGQSVINVTTGVTAIGDVLYFRYRVQYIDIRYVAISGHSSSFGTGVFCNFDLVGKTVSATGCTGTITEVSPDVFDIAIRATATSSAVAAAAGLDLVNSLSSVRKEAFVGDGVKSIIVLRYSSYYVTGYDISYVPPYVSVGVVATPFFGAGIDGAKYFSTDYTGGVALPSMRGIIKENAATNSLLRSRKFSNSGVNDLSGGSAWLCTQTTGSELITNGTFDTDTSWSKGATWSIGSGVASCTATAGGTISQDLSGAGVTSGKTYVITYTITRSAGSIVVSLGSTAYDLGKTRSASGTYTETIFCGANTNIYFYAYASFVGTVDDVSIKECAMQITTTTGLDGISTSATTLTASETDAIILQSVTLSSANRCASVYVKRKTGTGTISFTLNGGTNWTNITSLINSSTYARVQITATVTNPSIGFKISTSGDAIDVDCVQVEAGTIATSPIVTTTAAVTRNADVLTYQTSGNFSDTSGTAYVEVVPVEYTGGAIGSATNGLLLSSSNSGATGYDGTNTANGPTGTPDASEKLALNWVGTTMEVASSGVVGTAGTYDGTMGLSSIGIGTSAIGIFKNVAVYPYALSDADMVKITT